MVQLQMKCSIDFIGKKRNGVEQYWCITHKALASDKQGNRLSSCLCPHKEVFENVWDIEKGPIKSLEILFMNILENTIPLIFVNHELFHGVFQYKSSLLNYKDLVGIMLSKLNDISLEEVRCNHCNQMHSDNGKFAYTPHKTHLCLYCGHLFRVKEANIGSEMEPIFPIPKIKLEHASVLVASHCRVQYDLLKGILLINSKSVDKIVMNGQEENIEDFLNSFLENEY